jgi:predicted dehydrogenase
MSARDVVTVGIIGAGQGVRTHAAILSRMPAVRLVGVVGLTVDLTRDALRGHSLDPDLACTFDALIASDAHLVCVATPPTVRAPFIEGLAPTHSTLLIEKPLEADAARARVTYAPLAGRTAPAYLTVQLRGLPAFQQLKDMVLAGALGVVHTLTVRERTGWRRHYAEPWHTSLAAGGGQRLDLGPHLLDLVLFLLGGGYTEALEQVRPLTGGMVGWPYHAPGSGDRASDAADAVFRTAFHYGSCWVSLYSTSIGTGPETLELELDGTEGRVSFRFGPGGGVLDVHLETQTTTLRLAADGTLVPAEAAGDAPVSLFKLAYRHYVARILACIRGEGADGLATVGDGLANLAILDRMPG